jgi:AraC-like DNA-binding protein
MAITLSWDHYDQLWQASWEKEEQVDPWDPWDRLAPQPESLAKGYQRNIVLRNNILLILHDYIYRQDVKFWLPPGESDGLEFIFNLASAYQRSDGILIQPGQHYLINHCMQADTISKIEIATQPRQAVDVHISLDLLQTLIGNHIDQLPLEWQHMITGRDSPLFFPVQTTPPTMQMVLHQILTSPFQGVTKQLFLESKLLELLTWQLQSFSYRDPRSNLVKADRIYAAKTILDERLTDPPSLLELARLVGLNDRLLKTGFRQVLGTTVFGYVHQQRMEHARQLLASSQLSVWKVAISVGYANTTTFSKAFRKYFGVTPKKYQMGQRS